jgi:hypothetical protein
MDKVTSDGWEPDALTAQVRFWEGSAYNRTRIEYCDTTKRKRVANSEHKPYPKLERLRSTHRRVLECLLGNGCSAAWTA